MITFFNDSNVLFISWYSLILQNYGKPFILMFPKLFLFKALVPQIHDKYTSHHNSYPTHPSIPSTEPNPLYGNIYINHLVENQTNAKPYT